MALRGTLDTFALPDVLRLLGATNKTGRLRITGDRGTGSVWVTSGEVSSVEATHAPHAHEPVDALFELLRFQDGSFTFDAGASHDEPGSPTDVEHLLAQSETLLGEWHEIEAVVPSMDLWVALRSTLPESEVTLDRSRWSTIVAVGAGATVRRIGDELCLSELPVSRAIKDLVEAGLVEIAEVAPSGSAWAAGGARDEPARPLVAPQVDEYAGESGSAAVAGPVEDPMVQEEEVPAAPKTASGPRARRARATATPPPEDTGIFVPLELPGRGAPASYDGEDTAPTKAPAKSAPKAAPRAASKAAPAAAASTESTAEELDELAAAFPGLADRVHADTDLEDVEELAKQLATLSPRAAKAIRAAAAAGGTSDDGSDDGEDQPLSRGLLLKFLSSVKS